MIDIVVNRKYIQPYRARRQAELTFGREHPIIVTTLGGDSYTLEDWGHCKDLKRAMQKLAQETGLSDLGSFVLLDNDGRTAPPAVASSASEATSTEVDTEYGSVHRANMMQSHLLQGSPVVKMANSAKQFEGCPNAGNLYHECND